MVRGLIISLLLLIGAAQAQILSGILNPVTPPVASGIALDHHCSTDLGPAVSSVSCSLVVSAADSITCQGGFAPGNALTSFGDSTNGSYYENLSIVNSAVPGTVQAYLPDAAAGTYSPTMSIASASGGFIACQSWKNTRLTAMLDPAAVTQQFEEDTPTANPNCGTATSPTGSGELVISGLLTGNVFPPSGYGAGYTNIDVLSAAQFVNEYEIQTSPVATNGPYTMASDEWTDQCAAFLPSSAGAGVDPYQGYLITFDGLSNGVAPTTTTLANSTYGPPFFTSTNWAVNNGSSVLTGSTSGPSNQFSASYWEPETAGLKNGSGTLNFRYATGSAGAGDNIIFSLPSLSSTVNAGWYEEWTVPNNDTGGNAYTTNGLAGNGGSGAYAYATLLPQGSTMNLSFEVDGAGETLVEAGVTLNTVYWIAMQNTNAGTDKMAAYTGCPSACTQVGSTASVADVQHQPIGSMVVGSNGDTQSSGFVIYTRNVKMCPSGSAFPCMP